MLKERGIELIAADSPTSFLDDTPTAKLIRQVLGAVAESLANSRQRRSTWQSCRPFSSRESRFRWSGGRALASARWTV